MPRVTAGFFGSGRLFGVEHRPQGRVRDTAVVICPPLGYEAMPADRSLRLLASELADAGFPALRLQYHGAGESSGTDHDPARVRAWLDSIVEAVELVRKGSPRVALVGLRMGGTLAAMATERVQVDLVALWEPCLSGQYYLKEQEIASAVALKALRDRGYDLPQEGRLETGGYVITEETARDLRAVDICRASPLGSPEFMYLHRGDRPPQSRISDHLRGRGHAVEVRSFEGYPEMMVRPGASVPPREAFSALSAWLLDGSAPGSGGTSEAWSLEPSRRDGGRLDTVVRFGPDDRLFGVLTEPLEPPPGARDPVLFLAGGAVPRTAVNRMYVDMARALADRGHVSLRMDVSGIGESIADETGTENQPYPPSLVEDALAGVSRLVGCGGRPPQGVHLVGLCSGAWASLHSALRSTDVRSINLINPIFLGRGEADSFAISEDPASGKSSTVRSRKGNRLVDRLKDRGRPLKRRLEGWRHFVSPRGRELRADLRTLAKRGTGVRVALSRGHTSQHVFLGRVGPFRARRYGTMVQASLFDGADHTFTPHVSRRALIGWLVQHLSHP